MSKHKTNIVYLIIGIVIFMLLGTLFTHNAISYYINNNLSDDFQKLPKGDFLSESKSPDNKYTVKAYVCNGGGSTVSFSVRCEVIINDASNNKPKNIYWDYRIDKAAIVWESNNTVIINGHKITLPNGRYDWRKN
ncbi:DUF5412 domain-containing protein [Inconstantimicrobium mannanitabidum]|uniref:Uncharacterized protein n=1 Tax=Inconstantimicrobium mannanitabidum TaxID=1604901 RepID=A0ACB5RGY6_9CLOT|nr:DUF5412 domain-containing protein [Clostridium sp. TW13]GKX68342.1 hypothetical protein rsdtw13_36000 [Clostridium sp. TW13]